MIDRVRFWLRLASIGVCAPLSALASEPGPVHLSWVRTAGAESCPDVQRVQEDVERRLGAPLAAAQGPRAWIEALVTRQGALWRANIEMRGADGTSIGSRDVESDAGDCASLAAAAALAIALMIEPELMVRPEAPAPGPAPAPTTIREVARRPAPPPPPFERRGAVGLGALGAAGLLPEPSLGMALRGELHLHRGLLVAASALFVPEQTLPRADVDVAFGLTAVAPALCYRFELSQVWALKSCASVVLGALHVSVQTPVPVDSGQHVWWGAAGGFHLGLELGAAELQAGVEGVGHFGRRDYLLARTGGEEPASLHQEAPIAVLGTLLVGPHF